MPRPSFASWEHSSLEARDTPRLPETVRRFLPSHCRLRLGGASSTNSPRRKGCFLLRGDGAVPPGEVVEMPILEGLGRFSGDFVLTARHAVGAVEAFARGEAIAQLGEWVEL